jgi:hypothetical protein
MSPDRLEKVVITSPDNCDRVTSEISAGVAQSLGRGMTNLGWTWARLANKRITCTVVLPVDRGIAFGHGGLAPIIVLLDAMMFKFRLKTGPT